MDKSIQSPLYDVLRKKLIEIRKKAGLTQRELARKLRMTPSNVAHIEIGQRRVDFLEVILICQACKVNPSKVASEIVRRMLALQRKRRRSR